MLQNGKKYGLLVLVLVLLIADIFLLRMERQSSHRVLTIAMLDVGQGDAIFIESPTGTQILVDAGPARKVMGPLTRMMAPLDRTIDALIITNPDADHIAGFIDVMKNYEVSAVFQPGTLNGSKTFQNLKQEIKNKKVPLLLARKGMKIYLGDGAVIEILFPDRDVTDWATNDGSIVARLTYGENTVMLTGDATSKTEKIILNESKGLIDSDILKVGHHGSRSSSSPPFVQAVSPEYALISDGSDNKYGHPHKNTLDTLTQAGAKILRTDLLGNIIMKCDRMAVCEIKTSKN